MDIVYPDISIDSEKMTFITGESGTGKTSLLKMLNQTLSQTSGDIFFRDENVKDLDTLELRKKVFLCGQSVFLFDETVRDNFNRFRSYRNMPPLSDEDIKKFLDLCCIVTDLEKNCKNMSGGERARVFIAIYLSFSPEFLMLDEPTSALDKDTATALMTNLKRLVTDGGVTIAAVSHDRSIVEMFADDTIDLGGKKNG